MSQEFPEKVAEILRLLNKIVTVLFNTPITLRQLWWRFGEYQG
ncbi:MAG: hypothetical protein ACI9SB_000858 [Candidatus Azotimanducaceae bacterium]|jgi:hypothetical protein